MLKTIQRNAFTLSRQFSSSLLHHTSHHGSHPLHIFSVKQFRNYQTLKSKHLVQSTKNLFAHFQHKSIFFRGHTTGTPPSPLPTPGIGFEATLRQVLTPKQEELLKEEISLLNELLEGLKEFGATVTDLREVRRSIQQLEELFLLVVVGEFNSGKSSFLNALLGKKWLPDGITPTTSKINLLRYGEKFQIIDSVADEDGASDKVIVTIPVDWLKQINLVDTPGTNAVIKSHQEITQNFIPRSDLIFFVTSSDRAFTESERAFMELVHEYRKKFVIVLSKIDILDDPQQIEQLKMYVTEQCRKFFGLEEPEIFPVSSKLALKAKTAVSHIQDPEERYRELQKNPHWIESHFGVLETYILQHLNPQKRSILKLKNPLGVADRLIKKYFQEINTRATLLQSDVDILKNIQHSIVEFKNDMKKDFRYHQEHIDNVLLRLQQRGEEWFNNKIVLTQIFNLLRSETLRKEFEKDVVMDFSHEIEQHVVDLIDWILEKQGKFWTQTVEYMMSHVQHLNSNKVVGKLQMQFHYDRASLLQSIGDNSKKVVELWDKEKEIRELIAKIAASVYQTAALEIGALAGLAAAISLAIFDITGFLAITGIAVGGFGVLPYRRYVLRSKFKQEIQTIRDRMKETLESHFNKQLDKCIHDLEDNFRPYIHFIVKENQKLQETKELLQRSSKRIQELSQLIEQSFEKK